MTLLAVLIICGVTIIFISPLVAWPDRRNLLAWVDMPLLIIAYWIPVILFFDLYRDYTSLNLFAILVSMGGLAYFLGIIVGRFIKIPSFSFVPVIYQLPYPQLRQRYLTITVNLLLFSCMCLVISYLVMGFVPMFAADPFSAKFFKGPYKEPYDRVAVLYRLGTFIIPFILPLAVILLYEKFSIKLFSLFALSFVLMSFSLQRGPIGMSLLLATLVVLGFRGRIVSYLSLFLYFVIFCFGSALIWLLGFSGGSSTDLLKGIILGAPDLFDQLSFLRSFELRNEYAYGMTFVGGLIPGGFKWNPSVYTLLIANNTDNIDDISSGGFRLLSPLWGYVNFGYIGCVFVSLFHGLLTSLQIRFLRNSAISPLIFIVAYLYAKVFIGFFVNFYVLSMYSIPLMVVIFAIYYLNGSKLSIRKR